MQAGDREAAAALGITTRGQAGRDAARVVLALGDVFILKGAAERSTLAALIAEAGARTVRPTPSASAIFEHRARARVSSSERSQPAPSPVLALGPAFGAGDDNELAAAVTSSDNKT